jgi:hypothetical protein
MEIWIAFLLIDSDRSIIKTCIYSCFVDKYMYICICIYVRVIIKIDCIEAMYRCSNQLLCHCIEKLFHYSS